MRRETKASWVPICVRGFHVSACVPDAFTPPASIQPHVTGEAQPAESLDTMLESPLGRWHSELSGTGSNPARNTPSRGREDSHTPGLRASCVLGGWRLRQLLKQLHPQPRPTGTKQCV